MRDIIGAVSKGNSMKEVKITITDDGQTVIAHSTSIETRCADNARSLHALAEVLTGAGGLQHLASCSEASQAEVFKLLRTLAQEQLALTAALETNAHPTAREDAFRRAFRTGYSAGLQRTSSSRGEIHMKEAVVRTADGRSAAFRPNTTEH
jgi:glycerophosphoryl diester phosphodiesterase